MPLDIMSFSRATSSAWLGEVNQQRVTRLILNLSQALEREESISNVETQQVAK